MDTPIICSACGRLRNEDPPAPQCPTCGGTAVTHLKSLDAKVTVRPRLKLKARAGQPGEVGPHAEAVIEHSFNRRLGKWVRRMYRAHRDIDLYEEKIIDPDTGEVILHKLERLSEHQNRGAARRGKAPEGTAEGEGEKT